MTGGLPGLTASAAEVYGRLYPRVAARNAAYYRRYPEDVERVREIADHLGATEVRLPDGDRLTLARLRFLGKAFGGGGGFKQVHGLIEDAWHGDELGDPFRYAVVAATGFIGHPLFAPQEGIYGRPGAATGWAAEQALAEHPGFAGDACPLLFTGEMMYRWMFTDGRALRPFERPAHQRGRRAMLVGRPTADHSPAVPGTHPRAATRPSQRDRRRGRRRHRGLHRPRPTPTGATCPVPTAGPVDIPSPLSAAT
ncbi:hypothetical protein ACWDFL_36900 [Streptomyces bungoensis]